VRPSTGAGVIADAAPRRRRRRRALPVAGAETATARGCPATPGSRAGSRPRRSDSFLLTYRLAARPDVAGLLGRVQEQVKWFLFPEHGHYIAETAGTVVEVYPVNGVLICWERHTIREEVEGARPLAGVREAVDLRVLRDAYGLRELTE